MGTVMVGRSHARSALTRVSDGATAFCLTRRRPDSACGDGQAVVYLVGVICGQEPQVIARQEFVT
ncbi:MAG: hypothetical protein RMH97_04055 [Verrucomicrobiales bacterium]|nr:hypothetical protein [Verrucomicrobiales bacterium]